MAQRTMSEGARKVLNYMKEAGVGTKLTTKQVQSDLGFEHAGSVTGSVNGLVKKGYAVRGEEVTTDDEGNEKVVKFFYLTEEGANYDPDAVVEDEA